MGVRDGCELTVVEDQSRRGNFAPENGLRSLTSVAELPHLTKFQAPL